MTSYSYSSLNTRQPSIRLVRLIAGNEPIQCEIFDSFLPPASSNSHLTMAIPYEALSYAWGDNAKSETIIANGRLLGVTNNLYLALSYLRRQNTDRILWIDAICIDQNNAGERNHQVRQMASIYKSADAVILWLGQPTYATNVALDSLRQLENESKAVACRRWKKVDARWRVLWSRTQKKLARRYPDLVSRQREGLRELLDRAWFERVWIIQEVANARRALVCCGNKSVSARIFALSPHLFAVKPSDHAQAILDILPGPSRDDSWWAQKHDLYTLLRKFRFSKATDPRDMVYALVRIASDHGLEEVLVPNYEKTEREVIQETVSFLCHLDIEFLPRVSDGYWNAMVDDQSMTGFLKTIDSLYAAAMDQHLLVHRGDETTSFSIKKGRNVRITNEMLKLADEQRRKYGTDTTTPVELIIRHHADLSMLENAAINWHRMSWLQLLLQELPASVKITESVMEGATRNAKCAAEVLELLLQGRGGEEAPVTDRVLCSAAHSTNVDDIFEVLLRARGDRIHLTPKLLKILSKNQTPQKRRALKLLKEHGMATDLIEYLSPQESNGDGVKKDAEQMLEDFRSEWGFGGL